MICLVEGPEEQYNKYLEKRKDKEHDINDNQDTDDEAKGSDTSQESSLSEKEEKINDQDTAFNLDIGNSTTLVNNVSIRKNLVIDTKAYGCYFDAIDDK
ncbi:hypothetical protein KY289_016289 [Solanum tuberosum]|nr:hypothetical protein KY289_016289 [Solanum tuberosum]